MAAKRKRKDTHPVKKGSSKYTEIEKSLTRGRPRGGGAAAEQNMACRLNTHSSNTHSKLIKGIDIRYSTNTTVEHGLAQHSTAQYNTAQTSPADCVAFESRLFAAAAMLDQLHVRYMKLSPFKEPRSNPGMDAANSTTALLCVDFIFFSCAIKSNRS
jgi:hypothetical protein